MRVSYILFFLPAIQSGYAPQKAPELPDGFCPPDTGDITATTGGEKVPVSVGGKRLELFFFFSQYLSYFFLSFLLSPTRVHVSLATQRRMCWIKMSVSNGIILVPLHM